MKRKIIYFLIFNIVAVIGFGLFFLDSAMPIGNGYAAKYVCSQVFIAGRAPVPVFENDVKPTNFLFSLVKPEVDYKNRTVTSKAFGFWKPLTAVYREGFGCTLAVGAGRNELMGQVKGFVPYKGIRSKGPWPHGDSVDFKSIPKNVNKGKLNEVIKNAFMEPGPDSKRNTQAVVIIYKSRIIAEKYAPGFSSTTPILGWSMAKSVISALVGILVKDKKLDIYKPAPVRMWQKPADPRSKITLDQMLRMSTGLEFQEVYGPLKDATYMLYGSRSMADYAASKKLRTAPDKEWYYSSGTTNIIGRIIRDNAGGTLISIDKFVRERLFNRLGMFSAIIEPDASGSYVGSSYMFATARDWARFGLFILQKGEWNGEMILPRNWVKYISTPTPKAPLGEYGAHFWLNAGVKGDPEKRTFPSLPSDMVLLRGFNKQIVALIPSKDLVIVRLGVTHDKSWSHEKFIGDVIGTIEYNH